MTSKLKQMFCGAVHKHGILHVEQIDLKAAQPDYMCKCLICDKWFLTDVAGLRKLLRSHERTS